MDISIIEKELSLQLYGVSGIAQNQNWAETGFKLMNKMWQQVKANNLKNKGLNIWIYEVGNKMFTGVELEGTPGNEIALEFKAVTLPGYAYYKHIGPYQQITETCAKVLDELAQRGIKTGLPYLEIYGHWHADETKLETELMWSLI